MSKFHDTHKRESRRATAIALAITIVVSIISINFANLGGEAAILPEAKINYVKRCSLTFAPDVELGEVLEEYYFNEKWDVTSVDEDKDYVYFSGNCFSGGNTVEIRFRFLINTKENTIQILNVYHDNVAGTDRELNDTIIEIYTAYGQKHGMKFDFYGN